MAYLYTGEQFWTDGAWVVTAHSKPGQYPTLKAFMEAVNAWLEERDITYKWQGESTHTNSNRIIYYYTVRIPNAQARTMFNLRWS